MKLQAPKDKTGELHLNGRSFPIDKHGQVEVPENLLGSCVWQQGYTVVPFVSPEPQAQPEAPKAGKDKS